MSSNLLFLTRCEVNMGALMRFSLTLKNSLNRLQMFFYRPQNLFWILSSFFLSAIFLVLLPDNIYEYPNRAKGKLFQVFDFVVLIFSIFTLSHILDEKWASITAKKWKSRKKNYLIAESFWAGWTFSAALSPCSRCLTFF